ncbi:MAG: hypothetical protein KA713_10055 [Chryseotalea sp. WA131a]|jgi:hypothetical protein|nr:MAG: hypothetical protein KA713_01415 [Chryseotalea sp. WA131a]UXE68889.1 MAG: hypothetical protein KA713_10050 [Chryseotalea sp. WA131a]UXE68890.1 MAG: hypothetical protein KA713_10055 [Chryseotalea sp. WA131a]
MNFDPQGYKIARWLIVMLFVMFYFFAYSLIKDSFKTRKDFKVISGRVTEEGNTKVKGVRGGYSNVYYFGLTNHHQFLGVGTNEKLIPILDDNFRGLKVGDSIRVTFEENWATKDEPVNQVVKEIVRDGKVIYDIMPRTIWNGRMKLGLICLTIGTVILIVFLILNRKYYRIINKVNG